MREIKFRTWSKLLNKMLSHEDLNKTLKNLNVKKPQKKKI